MKSKLMIALGILAVLVLVTVAGCSSTGTASTSQPVNVNVGSQQTGIWVNGEGKITVNPDLATLTLGVSAQNETVAEAQSRASTAMDEIMQALTAMGIDKKDIQTRYYSIDQVTRWDDKEQVEIVTGYRVSNSVIAKLREMDKVGEVIDAVAAAGGDLTRINGINFSVEKPEQYYEQVRELAMQDAQSKASQIASLSGVTLGKATYVSENTSSGIYYPQVSYKMDAVSSAGGSSTSISAGEMDITLNVQVAYAIQ